MCSVVAVKARPALIVRNAAGPHNHLGRYALMPARRCRLAPPSTYGQFHRSHRAHNYGQRPASAGRKLRNARQSDRRHAVVGAGKLVLDYDCGERF